MLRKLFTIYLVSAKREKPRKPRKESEASIKRQFHHEWIFSNVLGERLKIVAQPFQVIVPSFLGRDKEFLAVPLPTSWPLADRDAVKSLLLFEAPLISGELETRVLRRRISAVDDRVYDPCTDGGDISNS